MPDYPAYHREPAAVVSTGSGKLKNLNKIAQPHWQYTEAFYHTEEAAEARMSDMAAMIEKVLHPAPAEVKKKAEIKSSEPLLPNDNQAGDGTRWDYI